MSNNIISTDIEGLSIKLNKVISDNRGYLAELMPGGIENDFCKGGFKNLYLSTANKKGVPRGGHYHKKENSFENFYCVSGLALWFFYDFRQLKSNLANNSVIIIVGEKDIAKRNLSEEILKNTKHCYFLPDTMAQILVPPKVYHIYIPLSDDTVRIVATHSQKYDPADYEQIDLANIPNFAKIIAQFNIKFPF